MKHTDKSNLVIKEEKVGNTGDTSGPEQLLLLSAVNTDKSVVLLGVQM